MSSFNKAHNVEFQCSTESAACTELPKKLLSLCVRINTTPCSVIFSQDISAANLELTIILLNYQQLMTKLGLTFTKL